ncbi:MULTISPECIES: baseplate J/gp47 family protein [Methylobacterium]|uniref:Baseplate protein J-like barrel domain-containing protein n=3 Tax=Pseudomonadota TaxID=1224 RepID=A0ABQ4T1E5_9HYPH|nr:MULTISPECIES: baseplate J/gp47 family protein [Methylobacterium]GBU18015.1 hypothetical protein AwMethylo_22300 [Methylobacterium sp.]GJE08620.1 hypothetical protein AOPFMNJM_3963 [Methylobacterium jeotgali]
MGSTPVCQITAAGIVRPDYAACLGYFQGLYRSIYGQDVYLGADCQDGQFMALLANALHDANGEAVAVYNAFSPATAQGAGLSSVVKINGIRRKSATYSTADVLIVGQVGAEIVSGAARDQSGNLWSLPDSVIIPPAGQITVTATCQTLGAVAAPSGAIDTIATPTLGWQSVGNPIAAAVGLPIETDRQLRQRQALSTALPAQTILEALVGALFAVTGVTRVKAYENDTNLPDGFTGAPGHTLTAVVEGGDVATIASVIAGKKSPGVGTYGDQLQVLTDRAGIPHPIRFFRPARRTIAWYVTLRPKAGYTLDVAAAIQQALAAYTNGIDIGANQQLSSAYPAANLLDDPRAATFEIVGLVAKRADLTSDAYGDIAAAFNEALVCDPSDVNITTVV